MPPPFPSPVTAKLPSTMSPDNLHTGIQHGDRAVAQRAAHSGQLSLSVLGFRVDIVQGFGLPSHPPGSTSQLGAKLWLHMSMSGSRAAGWPGPLTRNALEDVTDSAHPAQKHISGTKPMGLFSCQRILKHN